MKTIHFRFKLLILGISSLIVWGQLSSCNKKDAAEEVQVMATTSLYDTLGWFVQGATGTVAGQGIKMINDPANPGTQIQAGRLAIRLVVDSAIFVIASDPQMQPYFPVLLGEVGSGNMTGFNALEKSFTDFIQQAVSGQKVYSGKSMKDAHNYATYNRFGSNASAETRAANAQDFDRFVSDVAMAANKLNVPASVIGQLGALLYTTKTDIVQR